MGEVISIRQRVFREAIHSDGVTLERVLRLLPKDSLEFVLRGRDDSDEGSGIVRAVCAELSRREGAGG